MQPDFFNSRALRLASSFPNEAVTAGRILTFYLLENVGPRREFNSCQHTTIVPSQAKSVQTAVCKCCVLTW